MFAGLLSMTVAEGPDVGQNDPGVATHVEATQASPPAGSVDDTPSAPQTDEAPKEPSRAKTGRLVAAILVALVLVALGTAAYQTNQKATAAREAARKAISVAERKLDLAQTAVEPGTPEELDFKVATDRVTAAKKAFAEGSWLKTAKYESALSNAKSAEVLASDITEQVTSLAERASAEGSIDLYFELYERFPRTYEGKRALDDAATVLLSNLTYTDDLGALDQLADFAKGCPGDIPTAIQAEGTSRLRQLAKTKLGELDRIANHNIRWASDLKRGKSLRYGADGTTTLETKAMKRVLGHLECIDCEEYRSVFTALRDACALGNQCRVIANSPESRRGNNLYFGSSQLNRLLSLSRSIKAKTKYARTRLSKV